MSSSQHHFAC
uniref:Uncharacterized protein n=1 Tax=Arundo donax TaxID=35708 RepID=A0A0A9DQR5_ARUDO